MDRIDLKDGATGRTKTYQDQETIQKFLDNIKHMEFTVDPNQEPKSGYTFILNLYENNQLKLSMTNNQIGHTYYIFNENLHNKMKELYESGS
ncbi:hypothetical protein [Paenibacillus sp. YYML68]|uniref:hypothetical protein n=1 Tax=Paenibacillus sp. YYML68 TaxID=2909250 RepID=UPI0024912D5F|nr:hypothetical protein [Paenibacillus sp. YYML68]